MMAASTVRPAAISEHSGRLSLADGSRLAELMATARIGTESPRVRELLAGSA